MYLHLLNEIESRAFLSLAKKLAVVDDKAIDEREQYALRYMCWEMGFTEEQLERHDHFDRVGFLQSIQRPEAARVCLMEALGICFANNDYDTAQQQFLEEIAVALKIDQTFLSKAEELVQQQLRLMESFDGLIKKG